MTEVDFSFRTEKIGLELLMRAPHREEKPTAVAALSKNDFYVCAPNGSIYLDSKGRTSAIPYRLYTVKYVSELDLLIGITAGLPQIVFLNNLPGFKMIGEGFRTKISYINQIEYHNRKLIVLGSGFDIYDVTIKKMILDVTQPKIELNLVYTTAKSIYGSRFSKAFVDFTNERIFVPMSSGFTLYDFEGNILRQTSNFSPMIISTSAMIPTKEEVQKTKQKAGMDMFYKYVATDSLGRIRVWNKTEMVKNSTMLPNELFLMCDFLDEDNVLLITEKNNIYVYNTKANTLTEIMRCKNQIYAVSVVHNPERIVLVFGSIIEVYEILIPWKYWTKQPVGVKQFIGVSKENENENEYEVLQYLDINNGIKTLKLPNHKLIKTFCASAKSHTLVDRVYKDNNLYYYHFQDDTFEKYDDKTDEHMIMNIPVKYFAIPPNKDKIILYTSYNELILYDYHNRDRMIGKTKIAQKNILGMQALDKEVLLFAVDQIIFVSYANLGIRSKTIRDALFVSCDDNKFGIVYKDGSFMLVDSCTLNILCTFRCGKNITSLILQKDYFILITNENQIYLGREGCNILEIQLSFPIFTAMILYPSEDLYISSEKFICYIKKEDSYDWMIKKEVKARPLFETQEEKFAPKQPEVMRSYKPRPPDYRPQQTPRRNGSYMPRRSQKSARQSQRDCNKVSIRSLLQEVKMMKINQSQEVLPVSQLPELTPRNTNSPQNRIDLADIHSKSYYSFK